MTFIYLFVLSVLVLKFNYIIKLFVIFYTIFFINYIKINLWHSLHKLEALLGCLEEIEKEN